MPFRATARDLLKGRYDPEANTPANVLLLWGGAASGFEVLFDVVQSQRD
jgi:hypothetical protein